MNRVKLTRDELWRVADGGVVDVDTPVGIIAVEVEEVPWVPLVKLDPVPPHMIRAHAQIGDARPIEVWTAPDYEVIVAIDGDMRHLSIKRMDRAPIRNWRVFQQIKNETCGLEWEAVELFPAESRLADNANQYHLWAVPFRFPVGFESGLVTNDEQAAAFNAADHPGRQEPWQEGMTTGRNPNVTPVPDIPEVRRWLAGGAR